jgi:hypothetical protein
MLRSACQTSTWFHLIFPSVSVIVDRPNGPKQNDDGRDKENHGGVTSYDEQFQVELKNILDCDGRANVSVIDLKVS